MQQWVDSQVVGHGVERALLFCSPMAQFVKQGSRAYDGLRKIVIDFVDLDSEKWLQYADAKSAPVRWLYRREGSRLLAEERATACFATRSYFVSAPEAALFQTRAPESTERVSYFSNGVDADYFKPDPDLPNPYSQGAKALVFTGAMDYWPNVDAVTWFTEHVFRSLRAEFTELEFWIVGARPSKQVEALDRLDGITVTGKVHDIRPYLQHSVAAVAPMRIARGVQNKVVEALAMGVPIFASPDAMCGLNANSISLAKECGDSKQFIALLREHIRADPFQQSHSIMGRVVIGDWSSKLSPVIAFLLAKRS
jgi:sugar transferase (PEP-CTERM/EpsH1 system associated)